MLRHPDDSTLNVDSITDARMLHDRLLLCGGPRFSSIETHPARRYKSPCTVISLRPVLGTCALISWRISVAISSVRAS